MYRFGANGERTLVLLSAGNLATTQSVVARIERDIRVEAWANLMNVEDLPTAAEYIGAISAEEQEKHRSVRRGCRQTINTSRRRSALLGSRLIPSRRHPLAGIPPFPRRL